MPPARLATAAVLSAVLAATGCAKGSMMYGSELPILEDVVLRGRAVDADTGAPLGHARLTARGTRLTRALQESGPEAVGDPCVGTGVADETGAFELPMRIRIGVEGRSPLAACGRSDPTPPRCPLSELVAGLPDGRTLRVARPRGRWSRARQGTLVYRMGTVPLHTPAPPSEALPAR